MFIGAVNTLTLQNLSMEVVPVSDWFMLGTRLGVQSHLLHTIQESNPHNPQRCKLDMLDTWLRNTSNPSWNDVMNALCQMEEKKVAKKIEQMYCVQTRVLTGTVIVFLT